MFVQFDKYRNFVDKDFCKKAENLSGIIEELRGFRQLFLGA